MTIDRLTIAMQEAERFLARAYVYKSFINNGGDAWRCRENAAVLRSSMDLTKALADLRRPE